MLVPDGLVPNPHPPPYAVHPLPADRANRTHTRNMIEQDIVRTLKTMSEMDAKTDAGERGVAATLKRLADRLPACTQELCASEVRWDAKSETYFPHLVAELCRFLEPVVSPCDVGNSAAAAAAGVEAAQVPRTSFAHVGACVRLESSIVGSRMVICPVRGLDGSYVVFGGYKREARRHRW